MRDSAPLLKDNTLRTLLSEHFWATNMPAKFGAPSYHVTVFRDARDVVQVIFGNTYVS